MPRYLDTIAVGEYFAHAGGSAHITDVKQRTPTGWSYPVSGYPPLVYKKPLLVDIAGIRSPIYHGRSMLTASIVDLSHLTR